MTLPQGHTVRVREVPVRRAGIYAPGGQAPYPSSVIMGVATARAAGVDEVAVCATHPLMVRAAEIAGADEIHAMGGAHAIAALAYGTETVRPVDVIVGPGSLYAQEAKRQVSDSRRHRRLRRAERPADHRLGVAGGVAAGRARAGRARRRHRRRRHRRRPAAPTSACETVAVADMEAALAFSEAFAPEHLQLMGAEAEALAPRVRNAGAVFVGTGTAFGDYVAGSNHVLPTEGAARFASGLNVRHFLRVLSEVHIPPAAARALAGPGAAIANAEGFTAHAASMTARMDEPS